MPPTPASALPAKGAKSAKGARTRKVQRDMTIVHERKTTAANEASKISKGRLSPQLDAIVRSSTSVDKKVIQNKSSAGFNARHPFLCRSRNAFPHPALTAWRPRATASASASTDLVITEPEPI
jgi:hypothetical protein